MNLYLGVAKLFFVNQCVSNSPFKIRGGRGALTLQTNKPSRYCRSKNRRPPAPSYPRGGVENQHFIFVEFALKRGLTLGPE